MTTEHQDDQRRGGFREAVNELFGRGEREGHDTSQLDELNREEARRTGDPAYADQVSGARHEQVTAEQSQYDGVQTDDPAGQTTPGVRYDAGDPAAMSDTGQPTAGAHGDVDPNRQTATRGGPMDTQTTGRYDETSAGAGPADPSAHTPSQGQPVAQGEHTGGRYGDELRGDAASAEHVRQGGDPTAQGQVQHGGEVRGDHDLVDSGLPGDGRSDTVPAGGAARDAGVDAGPAAREPAGAGAAAGTATATGAAHHDATADGDGEDRPALVTRDRAESYSTRWDGVKGAFVDEPRRAVADADALVGELLDELQELFRQQRTQIEQGLDRDETSTEDLRVALRRYRSFFDRLLSI